jgi:hypothetical protein
VKTKIVAVHLFSVAAMLIAPGAHAQADDSAATAHQLMIRSGLSVQLRGFTDQLGDSIRQNAGNLDASVVASLVDAAKQAFRPDALQQDITARVGKKLTLGDMKAALAWLETDAGGRVTRAEELASVSLDMERMSAYAEDLKTKPLAANREKLITELVSASGAARNAAAVAETMALGVALGMDSLQPRERRVGEATLRARVREAMPPEKMQAFFGQQLPVTFAYTYRDTSDADLAAYAGFLKGVAGKRYQDAINAALLEGLARASVQVGEIAGQRQRQTAL